MARCELFLCGDVMTGRGIDQILPTPSSPRLHEPDVEDAREYVALAEEANGPIARPAAFDYVWGDALAELARASPDVAVANLETAVTTSEEAWPGKIVHYRMHPANVPCLTALGLDVCVLANNHVLDWGRAGLAETLETLAAAGLVTVGAGLDAREAEAPVAVPTCDGGRVLVAAVGHRSSGVPAAWAAAPEQSGVALVRSLDRDEAARVGERIARTRRGGDVAVVSIHWGTNWGRDIPDEHVQFAHALVDAGVDVVHGHSSHHARAVEIYRDKPILYGAGDFLTDYEGIRGLEPFKDDIATMYFVDFETSAGGASLRDLRIVPLRLRRMRLERGTRKDGVHLAAISRRFGTDVAVAADGSVVVRETSRSIAS